MSSNLDEIAAQWLARRAAGFTGTDQRDFERWLAADPRHATVFAELETTWALLDRLPVPEETGCDPDPDALAPHRRLKTPSPWWPLLAAAAALVVAYVGWWRPVQRTLHFTETVATAVGAIKTYTLPDESVIRLNTDSAVEIAYTSGERRVRLVRGEAHFTVTPQPERPFFVAAEGVTVRAVGTAFNVRLHSAAVEVLVTEGKVTVSDATRAVRVVAARANAPEGVPVLVAGERVVVSVADDVRAVPAAVLPTAEIDRALAWRERRLEFVATPLGEMVAEFNRYHRVQLKVDDPELAARRFGGSFRPDEPQTLIRLLETRFGLRAEKRGDVIVLLPAR